MSDVDNESLNHAMNDLLKNNPALLEGARNHIEREKSRPVVEPVRPTPDQVRAEIERLSGRGPLTVEEQRDLNRDAEQARLAEQYRLAAKQKEQDEAKARMQEIFRAAMPKPETA